MLMVSVSNALGKSYTALTISALRLFAFFLPCLWIGSQVAGIEGLFWGAMVGNILAGTCAWMMYQRALKQVELKLSRQ
jgi:Na+-driven multidrug efflux pump